MKQLRHYSINKKLWIRQTEKDALEKFVKKIGIASFGSWARSTLLTAIESAPPPIEPSSQFDAICQIYFTPEQMEQIDAYLKEHNLEFSEFARYILLSNIK